MNKDVDNKEQKLQMARLFMDKADAEFELKLIELEREGIEIAKWRKLKQLEQRLSSTKDTLAQVEMLIKELSEKKGDEKNAKDK